MEDQRTPISDLLRPSVKGSLVKSTQKSMAPHSIAKSCIKFIMAGHMEDGTTRHLIDRCKVMDIDYEFLDMASLEGSLELLSYIQDSSRLTSIYIRIPGTNNPTLNEIHDMIVEHASFYKGKIYGLASQFSTNHVKALHSSLVANDIVGTPGITITNHIRPITNEVVKSLSHIRSIASIRSDLECQDGERTPCPVQFQKMIVGRNIRVHVIDDVIIPLEIIGYSYFDYRYSGSSVRGINCSIPIEVEHWCLQITLREGLRFSGIDLIADQKNRWFCFEVNPSPGFHYFEEIGRTDKISLELLEHLCA